MDSSEETPDEEINRWRLRALAAEQRLRELRKARGPADIKRAVAQHFSLLEEDLIGADRSANLVLARHLAMYLCKQLLKMSYPEIGVAFGDRDHTTVMHAVRKIAAQRQDQHLGTKLREHLTMLLAILDPKIEPETSGHEDPGRADPGL